MFQSSSASSASTTLPIACTHGRFAWHHGTRRARVSWRLVAAIFAGLLRAIVRHVPTARTALVLFPVVGVIAAMQLAQHHAWLALTMLVGLAADNRFQHGITDFAQRALHGIYTLDFAPRQELLRLLLDDIHVQGWNVELRLRIPLDGNPPTGPSRTAHTRTRATARSPKRATPGKEPVSRNDRLRSTGERPQKHPQRRRRPHPGGQPTHPGLAQQVHVDDRIRPGQHPRHQRRHLRPGGRPTVRCASANSASPACRARPSARTSPAADTRLGSSNRADRPGST
jgi:hypothetical protein